MEKLGAGSQQPFVDPAPVQTTFAVGRFVFDDGRSMVVLQAQTPVGTSVYFLEPAAAVELARMLRIDGKAALAQRTNGHAHPPSG